jgi:hypothetical protein
LKSTAPDRGSITSSRFEAMSKSQKHRQGVAVTVAIGFGRFDQFLDLVADQVLMGAPLRIERAPRQGQKAEAHLMCASNSNSTAKGIIACCTCSVIASHSALRVCRRSRQPGQPARRRLYCDGRFDRHARSELARNVVEIVNEDFHRDALNDLYEVPSSILRRQQGEVGASPTLKAVDMTAQPVVRKGVDID